MKRDITVVRTDKNGYVSYEILPTHNEPNVFMACAQRFLKLLMADEYGGLVKEARTNKSNANYSMCVANTNSAFKRLRSIHPDSIYNVYQGYKIKKLDINNATSEVLLEIELSFIGGATLTLMV